MPETYYETNLYCLTKNSFSIIPETVLMLPPHHQLRMVFIKLFEIKWICINYN